MLLFAIIVPTIVCAWLSHHCIEASVIAEPNLVGHVHPKLGARWYSKVNNSQTKTYRYKFCALKESPLEKAKRPTVRHTPSTNDEIPKSFDARRNWRTCNAIKEIRDQANCGSCWAVAAAEAMSDRLCIHGPKYQFSYDRLSAIDLTSCCYTCGDGCDGGYPARAWDFWKSDGLVSEACKPYPWKPCAHHYPSKKYPTCEHKHQVAPVCNNTCDTTVKYYKYKGISSYNVYEDEQSIQLEIMKNGPVEAAFEVYEDFPEYRSGIYFHAWGEYMGGHAVRILGWGEENGVPYWLIANSWNEDWGEKGFVRFLRGVDECEIEDSITAGLPFY